MILCYVKKTLNFDFLRRDDVSFPQFEYNLLMFVFQSATACVLYVKLM